MLHIGQPYKPAYHGNTMKYGSHAPTDWGGSAHFARQEANWISTAFRALAPVSRMLVFWEWWKLSKSWNSRENLGESKENHGVFRIKYGEVRFQDQSNQKCEETNEDTSKKSCDSWMKMRDIFIENRWKSCVWCGKDRSQNLTQSSKGQLHARCLEGTVEESHFIIC
jgi:hypothetical protein